MVQESPTPAQEGSSTRLQHTPTAAPEAPSVTDSGVCVAAIAKAPEPGETEAVVASSVYVALDTGPARQRGQKGEERGSVRVVFAKPTPA